MTWLKIYGRDNIYTVMADKFAVKNYVASIIGDKYVVRNLAVANSWSEIDFSNLPEKFVVKCTHDSGGAFVCRDKKHFDSKRVRKIIERNILTRNYNEAREWPYKNIKPRIIIDEYLDDKTGEVLRDYKFWCFNGSPLFMYCTTKSKVIFENFYDMDFNPVYIDYCFPRYIPEF